MTPARTWAAPGSSNRRAGIVDITAGNNTVAYQKDAGVQLVPGYDAVPGVGFDVSRVARPSASAAG